MEGYLNCSGRLRGAPVLVLARHNGYIAVKLLERRGVWEKGDELTIQEGELRFDGGEGRKDLFEDLPVGKSVPPNKRAVRVYKYEQEENQEAF